MELSNLHSLKSDTKIRQLIKSLNEDYGIDIAPYFELSESELKSFIDDLEITKKSIVAESDFNSYHTNPQYVRAVLLCEAVKMVLKEIAPKRMRRKAKTVGETLDYKIHSPTGSAVDHDIDEDRERPDLYWRKHQWQAEQKPENHPVQVMDAAPAGESYSVYDDAVNTVDPYARKSEADETRTHEDEQEAGVYVAVMNPNRFLGDKETNVMHIENKDGAGNDQSPLSRKVASVMVDADDTESSLMSPAMYKESKQEMSENNKKESISTLIEGELERAEIVLATKDLVMRLNKMIEDIGKMGTDDIMPLVDGLRNNFGSDVAEQFSTAAEQHIQNTADALQKYRDAVDTEAQRLEGHISDEDSAVTANDMVDDSDMQDSDMEQGADEDLEDILGGDEGNADEEPLGRAKKESHVVTISGKKVRLSEDQIAALMKTSMIRRKIKALAEAQVAQQLAQEPKFAVINVRGNRIRVSESQVQALVFAKNFNKLVESKKAKTARLSESQAKKLQVAKKLTEKISKLTEKKSARLIDVVEK